MKQGEVFCILRYNRTPCALRLCAMPTVASVPAAAAAPYSCTGFSVLDARKPFRVQPLEREDMVSAASTSGSSATCGGEDEWLGLLHPPALPPQCGVLWVLHISKTGGETVRHHIRMRARQHSWTFMDLYLGTAPSTLRRPGRWEIEPKTRQLAQQLNQTRPRLVVHQHDGFGGLGDYFLDRVLRPLSCRFAAEGHGCQVVLATVLRDPVARLLSQARSDSLPHAEFAAFARAQANFHTKYVLFGTDWRVGSLFLANASVEQSLLEPARRVLSHFALVGRTEQLARYVTALDARMGWGVASESSAGNGAGATLHSGHQSKNRWNLTIEQTMDAHRFNRVDAQLHRSFCREQPASLTTVRSSASRIVYPLCTSEAALRGLPHFAVAADIDVRARPPIPEAWQMTFDGRSCHGFHLGEVYGMACDELIRSTLGTTFGSAPEYRREKGGKLVPKVARRGAS